MLGRGAPTPPRPVPTPPVTLAYRVPYKDNVEGGARGRPADRCGEWRGYLKVMLVMIDGGDGGDDDDDDDDAGSPPPTRSNINVHNINAWQTVVHLKA